MKTIGKLMDILRNPRMFRELISFYWRGYLHEIGWFNSFRQLKPVTQNNQPIPWVTYSFIDFISTRLTKDMVLLEFGSGYSTLFYSKHVAKVIAVEHDKAWFDEISGTVPSNAKVNYVALNYGGKYSTFALDNGVTADIIVVDGRDRVNCLKESVAALSPNGVMVLDDSEREAYKPGIEFMLKSGFKKIDFWGIAPGIFFRKCTTVFYRPQNCLDI